MLKKFTWVEVNLALKTVFHQKYQGFKANSLFFVDFFIVHIYF